MRGEMLHDRTKLLTARGMLPPDTPASVHLALRGISGFDLFKTELRKTIRYLEDHGGVRGPRPANVVQEGPFGPR